MSKSYNNVIPIFAPEKQLRKQVMRIVTDSKTPDEPKDPQTCNLYAIYKLFAKPDQLEGTRKGYVEGGLGYGDLKKELAEMILAYFSEAREKYDQLIDDHQYLDKVLAEGAEKARAIAKPILTKTRKAIGID